MASAGRLLLLLLLHIAGDAQKIGGEENRLLIDRLLQKFTAVTSKINQRIDELQFQLDQLSLKTAKPGVLAHDKFSSKLRVNCVECSKLLHYGETIKENFFNISKRNFYYEQYGDDWLSASVFCQERGMRIAVLKQRSEMESVSKELRNQGWANVGFWVGATDIGWPLGQFHWTEGTKVASNLWFGAATPRNFNSTDNKTCAYLLPLSSRLYHDNCTTEVRSFLCELPTQYTSCLA